MYTIIIPKTQIEPKESPFHNFLDYIKDWTNLTTKYRFWNNWDYKFFEIEDPTQEEFVEKFDQTAKLWVVSVGGYILPNHNGMFFIKAPISYKTRSIPVTYPWSTYMDENEESHIYKYGEYHFHSGKPPYFREDDDSMYFTASKWNGQWPVDFGVVVDLISDWCTVITREEFVLSTNVEDV